MPAQPDLLALTHSALLVLDAWGRACSPEALSALDDALSAGGEPALIVTATFSASFAEVRPGFVIPAPVQPCTGAEPCFAWPPSTAPLQ